MSYLGAGTTLSLFTIGVRSSPKGHRDDSSRSAASPCALSIPASNERMLENNDLLKLLGGPARIRTGDRQVSRTRGYEPAALSVLQPEENLAELRALQG